MAAPQISKPFQKGDYVDEQEGGGGFFSQKLGPLPLWAVIAGVGVILYVLYTKFIGGSTSSSTPAVTTTPDQTGAPYSNLNAALAQVQANEQQIASLIGTSTGPTPTTPSSSSSSSSSNTPSTTYVAAAKSTASAAYADANQLIAQHNSGPPSAPPISSPVHLLNAQPRQVIYPSASPTTTAANPQTTFNPTTPRSRGTQAIA